ncbi:MAG TPA: ABC transporter substrate-binding protein [Clostridiales bacterium UBA8960]|nr:ABC transporter substrate-binding protein [Clostridiales bacterium UBA8960]
MKKVLMISLLALIILVTAFTVPKTIFSSNVFYKPTAFLDESKVEKANILLKSSLSVEQTPYVDYLSAHIMSLEETTPSEHKLSVTSDYIGYEDQLNLKLDIDKSGLYRVFIEYEIEPAAMNNATFKLLLNGALPFDEAGLIDLPLWWRDASKTFELDSYGDESLPLQETVKDVHEIGLHNNLYYSSEPLLFHLDSGKLNITIENVSATPFKVVGLKVMSATKLPNYMAYKAQHVGIRQSTSAPIIVDATQYSKKNSSYVRLDSHQSPTVQPFDPVNKKLNVLSGHSWNDAGKEVVFQVNVNEPGAYQLSFHFYPGKDDFNVFRSVRINGRIPFEEMRAYALKDHSGSKYVVETLSDEMGNPYYFYLEEGTHEIALRAEVEPLAQELRTLQLLIDHINQFALDIRKITGREVDKKRTWRLSEYIPETQAYLEAYDTLLKHVIENSMQYAPNGYSSSTLSYLQKALVKVDKMLEKPDELPLYFEDLYSGSGSVNQMIGDTITLLSEQPLTLNLMALSTDGYEMKANAPFTAKIIAGFKSFFASFTENKYVVRNDEDVLNIWINRQITHVDTLQKLVDSEFTPLTGIKVKISVMPDANKLILASAANEAPDVAMGLLSYMPFDLAIREAAYDLTQFDDFWEIANRFTPGAFVPYILDDGVYAIPETLEFFSTIYRKDIFASLGLDVPDTWRDVTELLPELQRYGMNFYHPIAGGGSIKWFYQTSPFIYQMGGELYTQDGFRSAIDQPEAVAGLEFLNKLFTMYALPEQEPIFYNAFRYGTLPIGIADFTTYMQVKNAAPELVGKWAIAPYPAMRDSDGELNRWFIANGRGSLILKETKKADEAWAFLKWWTSESVQTTYSYTLQSIYGPEYLWLSGNVEAVKNAPIDMQDKIVILDQINWLRDVPRTPGQYMLERGISDIWNKAVYDNMPTRIAIDRQIITINREIRRKMTEFGYLDEQGNVIKTYNIRDVDWVKDQIDKHGRGRDDE